MGVKNLWSILTPVCERKSLCELHDKAIAVDLSCWVCDSQKLENRNQPRMYLRNLFFRTSCLLLLGVKPVFVLEGTAPSLKHDTMSQRVQQRRKNRKQNACSGEDKAKMCEDTRVGRSKGCRSHLNFMLKQCEVLLTVMGVPCVQSFGEAEALCAQLDEAGLVDGCITQDGDCFLYGARTVYRNFSISQKGSFSYSVEEYKMAVIEEKLALSRVKLIALSLLCGCDYNDRGVLGVGKESALKFLEGLEDDEVLPRLKRWRTDPYYECLEAEYLTLGNTCSKCTHTGKLQKHAKSGCEACGTKCDCIQITDMNHLSQKNVEERQCIIAELKMRKMALQNEDFPSQAMMDEFFHRQPLPKFDLNWKQPDIMSFIKFSVKLLSWTQSYAVVKFIPLVTRWQLHNLQNATRIPNQAALPFMPVAVIKKRVLKGVLSFEVRWKDNHDILCNVEHTEDLLVTTEPQEIFRTAYPDLVAEYAKEKEAKSRKGRMTNRKVTTKLVPVKTCCCQCKENVGSKNCNKQSHICGFVKSASNTDDISKIRNILGNLDINCESEKENPKNSSQKDAKRRQSGPKTAVKQQKITFNYLYSKLDNNTEHNIGQMSQKEVNETNLGSSFKIKSDTHSFSTGKGENLVPCKKLLDSEVYVGMLSVKETELANDNLPCGEPERKGILEEYDCLDVDDEIKDMSSIIQNIVCGLQNESMP